MYSSDRDDDRLAVMEIAPQTLLRLGSGTFRVVEFPLPDDAEIVRSAYDQMHGTFMLLLRSKEFSPLLRGNVAPHVKPPMITRVEPIELTAGGTEE